MENETNWKEPFLTMWHMKWWMLKVFCVITVLGLALTSSIEENIYRILGFAFAFPVLVVLIVGGYVTNELKKKKNDSGN